MVLVTLVFLEVALGVDNILFITLAVSGLPEKLQPIARKTGLCMAMLSRLFLLYIAFVIATLDKTLFIVFNIEISIKSIFFIFGAVFLWIKAIEEIRNTLVLPNFFKKITKRKSFFMVILEIMIFDIVFSLDSIITAIGITDKYWITSLAIIIAVLIMLFASEILSNLIIKYKRLKMLALCFLFLIGIILFFSGINIKIPNSYFYIVVIFSLFVESLNIIEEKLEG